MEWQEFILDRLNLTDKTDKIISDQTGLLLNYQFLAYLSNKSIEYSIFKTESDLIHNIKSSLNICCDFTVPAFIQSKFSCITFDWKQLPFELEPSLQTILNADDLVILCKYFFDTGKQGVIRKSNFKQTLKDAEIYIYQEEIRRFEQTFNGIQEIGHYNVLYNLGPQWGEYIYKQHLVNSIPDFEVMEKIDSLVQSFILNDGIKKVFYESESKVKTVDKILPFIKQQNDEKIALICFDGMGWAEWLILKDYLKDFEFNIMPTMALIPTVTSISRSAIFSGKYETGFEAKSINEKKWFADFWSGDNETHFFKEGELIDNNSLLGIDKVAMIYNVFDDLAHATKFPPNTANKSLYFESIKSYLSNSGIQSDLVLLKNNGYKIYFCSDHGSVVGKGSGQKIDKYLIEKRTKRATIIQKSILSEFYNVDTYDIPFTNDKIALLCKDRLLFSPANVTEISHGGVTLEELIIPFVEVIN